MWKRLIGRRKSGSGDIIGIALMTIISIVAIFIMILATIHTNKTLDNQDYISSVLRSYVTKMELAGCLNQSDVEALVKDLKSYGMTEIHLYGNFAGNVSHVAVAENYGPADYVEPVQLRVTGIMEVKNLEESEKGFLNRVTGFKELEVDLQQKGIAVR